MSVAVLQLAILWRSQHHGLRVLGSCCWRLVEIEDTLERVLLATIVLEAKLGAGPTRCKSLDRTIFTLYEVLLDRHVAHQSTLWRLDLVEKLSLVTDLDRENLGCMPLYERNILFQFRF